MLLLRCAVALLALLGALLPPLGRAPGAAHADVLGGAATSYTLPDASSVDSRLVSPWFVFGWEGWSSTLALHNVTASALTATLTARDGTGPEVVGTVVVPPRGLVVVNGNDLGLRPGVGGSLTVTGGPFAAVVDYHAVGRNRLTLPALPGAVETTTAYVPLVFRAYHGWSSTLVVANTAQDPNEVEVVLRAAENAAAPGEWRTTLTVPAGASAIVPLDAAPPNTPLSATLRSTNNRTLVAATYNLNDDGAASAAAGFARGAATLYLSLLYRNANGFESSVQVQNVGPDPATPELRLLGRDGALRTYTAPQPLPPGASRAFYLPILDGVPANFTGAGIVSSVEGGPLVALAHHVNRNAHTAMQTGAVTSGSATLVAPVVYGEYAGYSSGLQIANVDAEPTSVSVALYDTFGNRLLDTEPMAVEPGATATLYVPAIKALGPGFIGSAAVTTPNGRKVVVSATQTRPASADTTLAIVDGIPLHRIESAGTNVFFAEGVPQERVQGSLDGLNAAREEIPTMLDTPAPAAPLEVFLFASQNGYRRGRATLTRTPIQQVPTFSDGVSLSLHNRTAILEDVGGPYRTAGSVALLIAHEYTHGVIDASVRGRGIPRWLNEGLANWAAYDLIRKRYPNDAARQWRSWQGVVASALATDGFIDLSQMTTYAQWVELGNSGRDDLIYGEAVLAVDRLVQTYGLPTVARMLKRVGQGSSVPTAFADVTGGTIPEFSDGLRRELDATLARAFPQGVSALPNSGTPGTTFSFNAIAWTPRQRVTVTVTRPNGTQLTFTVTTSSVGFLDWAFATNARSLPGAWRASFQGEGGDEGEVSFSLLKGATDTTAVPAASPDADPASFVPLSERRSSRPASTFLRRIIPWLPPLPGV